MHAWPLGMQCQPHSCGLSVPEAGPCLPALAPTCHTHPPPSPPPGAAGGGGGHRAPDCGRGAGGALRGRRVHRRAPAPPAGHAAVDVQPAAGGVHALLWVSAEQSAQAIASPHACCGGGLPACPAAARRLGRRHAGPRAGCRLTRPPPLPSNPARNVSHTPSPSHHRAAGTTRSRGGTTRTRCWRPPRLACPSCSSSSSSSSASSSTARRSAKPSQARGAGMAGQPGRRAVHQCAPALPPQVARASCGLHANPARVQVPRPSPDRLCCAASPSSRAAPHRRTFRSSPTWTAPPLTRRSRRRRS